MALGEKIQGIFTPNIVPLDEQGQINEPELRRYVDWLIDHGVHGLYPNGSTGEFTRFSADERRRIVRIMAEQAAGRVPILAGAAEANTRETLAACEYYHDLGVRAVAIVAPFYYRLSPDNVYSYFKEIGDNTPIDVTLYNIPMFASPIDVPTIQRLSEDCPRIMAIKDSSGDVAAMTRMIQAVRPNRPDFSFLCGWEAALLPMLVMGCDGGTNATSGIVPEITRKLYDAFTAGWLSEARQWQFALLKVFDPVIQEADFPEAIRLAVQLRGIRTGWGRQPLSEEHKTKLQNLEPVLRGVFAELGIQETTDADSLTSPDLLDLGQIVDNVVAVLRERGMA